MSMKQTLLQFKSLLLMLCMLLGIGNAWAAELNETITFKVYNDGKVYSTQEQLQFTENKIFGKARAPFVLHVSSSER